MADSQHKTNRRKQSRELVEAFMHLNTKDTILEEVTILRKIARDDSEASKERIGAIKTIWDYAMVKPRQGIDVSTLGKEIKAIQVEIIEPRGEDTES